jgi:hypothetical protein
MEEEGDHSAAGIGGLIFGEKSMDVFPGVVHHDD